MECPEKPSAFSTDILISNFVDFPASESVMLDAPDCILLPSVPLLFKYGYTGPVYTTSPTRDLAALLQNDYLKVSHSENKFWSLVYTTMVEPS